MESKIAGLTTVGYTAQTFALAHALTDANARLVMRELLEQIESPVIYSGQEFDRKQYVAVEIADLIREALTRGAQAS